MSLESFPSQESSSPSIPNEELRMRQAESRYKQLEEGFNSLRESYEDLVQAFPKPKALSASEIGLWGVPQALDEEDIKELSLRGGDNLHKGYEEYARRYEKYDPGFAIFLHNSLSRYIRGDIGANFKSEFLSNPYNAEDATREPWYDAMGMAGYITKIAESQLKWGYISEEKRDELMTIQGEVERKIRESIPYTNEANPQALVYGLQQPLSSETKDVIWRELSTKYASMLSPYDLGHIITSNKDNTISAEAWNILKSRPDTPLILFYRLSGIGETQLEKEAAQRVLKGFEELEVRAQSGDLHAASELNQYSYTDAPEIYKKIKERLKSYLQ